MAIKGKSTKQQQKQKNIKRTNSIQEVIKESQSFLKVKPQEKKQDQQQIKKVTKKIQKKTVPKKNEKKQQQQQKQKEQQQQKQQQKPKKQQKQQKQEQQQQQQQEQIQEEKNIGRSRFTDQERENYLNREELQEGKHELDEHRNFRERYLGREGAFSNFKILIGCFYNFENDGGFDACPGAELKRRGFKYEIERDFDRFVSKMINYDIVWLISQHQERTSAQKKKLLEETEKLFKAKKSLYLWSDNTPYHKETDYILQKFFNGMHMQGMYYGDKVITKGKLQKGQFDETHSIGYGLNNLHEGITICAPQKTHPDFVHFAYNSNNEPLVSYAEENENHGRIILDCGFTKMFKSQWGKAGTSQYVSNSNVWLTGIPQ